MSFVPLPDELRVLIHQHLRTMEHVDLLLLLIRVGAETRSAAALTAETRLAPVVVEERVADLVAAGLVTKEAQGGTDVYRYAPADLSRRRATELLVEAHRSRPVSLIREVYERPNSAAVEFANAFRLRKEDA